MLLALPALRGEDKPKDSSKPSSPGDQYSALVKEYQEANQTLFKSLREAKGPEEQQKVFQEMRALTEKFAARFLELAEKNPKEAAAVDALIWIVTNSRGAAGSPKSTPTAKAVAILVKEHVTSDKMGAVCQALAFSYDDTNEKLLRAVFEKNPAEFVQAEACLALAQNLRQRSMIAKRLRDDPELAARFVQSIGKDTVEELKKADIAKLETAEAEMLRTLVDKYVAEMKPERLANLCQQLSFSAGPGGEMLLRTLMEKDTRAEVQGVACLSLASALKQRSDTVSEKDAKEGAKLRSEAEELFQRAIDKYADVKMSFRGTVGERAKSELYEIRHLAIGMTVPDVEGQDQDGKKFRLADYKGKVILLDFWSEF